MRIVLCCLHSSSCYNNPSSLGFTIQTQAGLRRQALYASTDIALKDWREHKKKYTFDQAVAPKRLTSCLKFSIKAWRVLQGWAKICEEIVSVVTDLGVLL